MIRAFVLVTMLAGCPAVGGSSDSDGDGIAGDVDKCTGVPEDFDGFEDADGCPEADNDRDGILDEDDRCPNNPETKNGVDDQDGCPDQAAVPTTGGALPAPPVDDDPDKDGIHGTDDKCPNEPEVYDGVADGDGCPDGGKK